MPQDGDAVPERGVAAEPPVPHQPHTSATVINLLKNMSLTAILQKNKQIEAENVTRSLKNLEHAHNPKAHPAPRSEMASLITIEEEDLNCLKVPSFLSSFHNWIYPSLANFLAVKELKEKEEKAK